MKKLLKKGKKVRNKKRIKVELAFVQNHRMNKLFINLTQNLSLNLDQVFVKLIQVEAVF